MGSSACRDEGSLLRKLFISALAEDQPLWLI
jgi:hypothetical protein